MTRPATMVCRDALIVFEGAPRIRRRGDNGGATELWPDAREASLVKERLVRGQPILVVLGGPQAEAALLAEQFAQAPPALVATADSIARDLVGVRVPPLDWLPGALRERGLRFLRSSTEHARRTPAALCPALCLDERDLLVPHVRFAHCLRECLRSRDELESVVAHAFRDVVASEAP